MNFSRNSYLEDGRQNVDIWSPASEHHQDRTVFRRKYISKQARFSSSLTKLAPNAQYQVKKEKKKVNKNIHHRV
jgi:hypothetical protein